jgi:hypothetical protein
MDELASTQEDVAGDIAWLAEITADLEAVWKKHSTIALNRSEDGPVGLFSSIDQDLAGVIQQIERTKRLLEERLAARK